MSDRPLIVIDSSREWLEDERKRLEAENQRLKAINAELLAALESVLSRGCMLRRVDELEAEYVAVPHPETTEEIRAVIANVQPQGEKSEN